MSDYKKTPVPHRKPFAFTEKAVNNDLRNFIKKNEATVPYLYRDHKGNVTTGIGYLVGNVDEVGKIPFYKADRSGTEFYRNATETEKRDAYNQVLYAPIDINKSHKNFNPINGTFTPLYLKSDDMDFLLEQRLRQGVIDLMKKFPDFDTYPPQVRQAMQDMEFQIGPTKFNENRWPAFFKAVRNRDWRVAAEESRRDIFGDEKRNADSIRNKDTKQLFLDALRRENLRK